MPTEKPRVTVTLNRVTYEVIAELAKLQKRSKGAVIAEYLDTVQEPLSRLVALLQTANEAPGRFRRELAGVLVEQQVEIENRLGATLHELFAEPEGENPHPYNMGVRSVDNPKRRGKRKGSRP